MTCFTLIQRGKMFSGLNDNDVAISNGGYYSFSDYPNWILYILFIRLVTVTKNSTMKTFILQHIQSTF